MKLSQDSAEKPSYQQGMEYFLNFWGSKYSTPIDNWYSSSKTKVVVPAK